jgi:hypothetical protein
LVNPAGKAVRVRRLRLDSATAGWLANGGESHEYWSNSSMATRAQALSSWKTSTAHNAKPRAQLCLHRLAATCDAGSVVRVALAPPAVKGSDLQAAASLIDPAP